MKKTHKEKKHETKILACPLCLLCLLGKYGEKARKRERQKERGRGTQGLRDRERNMERRQARILVLYVFFPCEFFSFSFDSCQEKRFARERERAGIGSKERRWGGRGRGGVNPSTRAGGSRSHAN